MWRDNLGKTYQKVIVLQALLATISSIAAWVASGQASAISAAVGGAAVLSGSLVYAVLARESRMLAASAGKILARHLIAEAAKVFVILTFMLASLASGWFVAGWLIAAMAVTLLGHLLALMTIR